jgi:hypothetical protein
MTNFEPDNGTSRDELVQRVALMESMIAEGRRTTTRYGWMFLLWGLVYFTAMLWVIFLPFRNWAWPVCVALALVIGAVVKWRRRAAGGTESLRSRSIESVWKALGTTISLFVVVAIATHHFDASTYFGAILFFLGMAHATSALILRWGVQGVVAAIWWAGGVACFIFTTPAELATIFLTATFFGMILFGLYAMWLERRRASAQVEQHA